MTDVKSQEMKLVTIDELSLLSSDVIYGLILIQGKGKYL